MPANVTPIRRPPVQASPRQAGVAQPAQQWWGDPSIPSPGNLPTIWPPPGVCGPCVPTPCPPFSGPSCTSTIAKANQCWDDSQAFQNLVGEALASYLATPAGQQLLSDTIQTLIQTTPGLVPPNGGLGVVDGSKATSGQIGEVILLTTKFNFTGYPNVTEPIVTLGSIPAGDWDFNASAVFNAPDGVSEVGIGGASMAIQNIQTTTAMLGLSIFGVTAGQALEGACLIAQKGSWSYAQPQLIQFQMVVNQSTDASLTGGVCTVYFEARRAR